MQAGLALVLLAPVLASALAGPYSLPLTALPDERPAANDARPEPMRAGRHPGKPAALLGTVDTIGGTTYDWQYDGPALRMLVNSPGHGLHAAWMYSADTSGRTFPDRNMRYNYYDYFCHAWNWIDPDFMASGINVFTQRCGFGNLDADPLTGVALVSAHSGAPVHPGVARDLAPGAGIFEYCSGSPVLDFRQRPRLAVDQSGKPHAALLDDATLDSLFYSKVDPWCTWHPPVNVPYPEPQPLYPDHNIAASKVSEKVCITWVHSPDEDAQQAGYYRISTDGGATWGPPTQLPWPDAYGGDTLTSFHITSLFPFYDRYDDLHFAAGVVPFINDTGYVLPAEIWHWNRDNTPNWSEIHRSTDVIEHPIGYNATMACRPSLGQDRYRGYLYAAWEEFDGINYEPGPPERLRADIYWSVSSNNGQNWVSGQRLTTGGTVSHRFPSLVDWTSLDSVCVLYMIDQHAGFAVMGEGPATFNPVVVHWPYLYGIAGPAAELPAVPTLVSRGPVPFTNSARFRLLLPAPAKVSASVHDVTGQRVAFLNQGLLPRGEHDLTWDCRTATGARAAPGVYYLRVAAADTRHTRRLVLAR